MLITRGSVAGEWCKFGPPGLITTSDIVVAIFVELGSGEAYPK